MAKYDMQEMNLPHKGGKPVLYPRLVLYGQVSSEQIAEQIAAGTTFGAGEVKGLIQSLVHQMAWYLGEGYSVKIEGFGTFTATLALRKEKEREEAGEDTTRRNARSIEVGGARFVPNKQFVNEIDRHCVLERQSKAFRHSSDKYTPEQRLALAQKYLEKNPYLTVGDYEALTGLCHTAATKELRVWANRPDTGIYISGRGSHRVYVRRTDPQT